MGTVTTESWTSASAYEIYVGRWSRIVAAAFIDWLAVPPKADWADVGCGTGALSGCIIERSHPAMVRGIDRSQAYIEEARVELRNGPVQLEVGDACALPWPAAAVDVAVSGLVLNFVSDAAAMAREMVRVTRPGGKVGVYVWDYAGGMQMLRHFWDAAVRRNPGDSRLDQGERFPLCQPEPLHALFQNAGMVGIETRPIDIVTVFRDFEDYWKPFTGKQGSAPAYLASLTSEVQGAIREDLRARLVASADGSITLTARAWAAQGTVPPGKS